MTTQTSVRALNPSGNNNEALILPRRSGYAADGAPGHVGHSEQDYWFALIDEKAAAEFLGLTDRTMQGNGYRGGGCRYIRLSSRCIRYRRVDLREWAESRIRTSTSDPGEAAA